MFHINVQTNFLLAAILTVCYLMNWLCLHSILFPNNHLVLFPMDVWLYVLCSFGSYLDKTKFLLAAILTACYLMNWLCPCSILFPTNHLVLFPMCLIVCTMFIQFIPQQNLSIKLVKRVLYWLKKFTNAMPYFRKILY